MSDQDLLENQTAFVTGERIARVAIAPVFEKLRGLLRAERDAAFARGRAAGLSEASNACYERAIPLAEGRLSEYEAGYARAVGDCQRAIAFLPRPTAQAEKAEPVLE